MASASAVRRAVDARAAWTWDREVTRVDAVTLDAVPDRCAVLCEIEVIDYRAAKGRGAPAELWRHELDEPFPLLLTASLSRGPVRATRDVPRVRSGSGMFLIGELVGIHGTSPEGFAVSVPMPRATSAKNGVFLVGNRIDRAPSSLVILRRGNARRTVAPLFVGRNGSPYQLTERGIVR